MLNLVQIQDKLKDMPTQAIMSYANGQNPMVPPYLALGELNRRKQMEQSAMGEQAKMQGEPPTIKQATEEQLGLMNLQKQRAMQAQQNMGRSMANAPSPVPAGVGEEPVQMARGGIARLPLRNFRRDAYAGGGIVAFQEGGLTEQDLMKKIIERAGKEQTMEDMIAEQKEARRLAGASEDPYAGSRAIREELQGIRSGRAEGQPMRELIGYLSGIAKAKPMSGIGVALGGGAEEQQKSAAEFAAEQDKQKAQEMAWMRADEKEKDALARGDADAALKAKRDKERLQYDVAKLSTTRKTEAYGRAESLYNQNPEVKANLKKQQDLSPSDPEYIELDKRNEEIRQGIYKSLDLDTGRIPPRAERPAPPPKKKEKNFFQKMFSSDEEPVAAGPQIPAGLPAGTVYAGKDKATNKDVYRTPDGKLLTAK